jgi:hypothetical protein
MADWSAMSGSSLNAATIAVRAETIDGTTAYTALDVQGWTTFRSKEGEHDRSDDVWGASIDRWPHRPSPACLATLQIALPIYNIHLL